MDVIKLYASDDADLKQLTDKTTSLLYSVGLEINCAKSASNSIKLLERARRLCSAKLSAKNLMLALNEFATSLFEYPIGILEVTKEMASNVGKKLRDILMEFNVHNLTT